MAKKAATTAAAEPTVAADLQSPEKGNCSKATWSGFISAFGVMLIPAKGYKATDTDKIERNMYHSAECMNRLEQTGGMKCKGCNASVNKDAAVKAVTENGKTVILTDAEVEAQKPAKDGILKISEFVPMDAVNVIYYESSEFIAAEKGGEKAFATFQQGLAKANCVAIGTFVSRGHQYTVAIRPYGANGLVMSYLFAEYEVRECGKWTPQVTVAEEVELVAQLIETQTKEKFTAAKYDVFLYNVRKLIEAKANGTEVNTPNCEEAPKGTDDLLNSLKAMLDQQQKSKAAKA